MNLALSSILIFLVFFPGILFRRAYYFGKFSKEFRRRKSPLDEVTSAILPGILLQLAGIWVSNWVNLPYAINFEDIGYLLLGAGNTPEGMAAFSKLLEAWPWVLLYNSFLWFLALSLGYGLRALVRRQNLDRRFHAFRFDNDWFYTLTGERLLFPENREEFEQLGGKWPLDLISVDVLTEVDGQAMIYSGVLREFEMAPDGGLDSIMLSSVRRRPLIADTLPAQDDTASRYYHLAEDNLVIFPFSNIRNLNVRYVNWEQLAAEEDPTGPAQP